MFCSKHSAGRINNMHEQFLRLIQQNYISDFEILSEDANEKSVHRKCIKLLMMEVYKYLNGLSPNINNTTLKLRQHTYNLREFQIRKVRLRQHYIES